MPYRIVLAPEAVEDLRRLPANVRAEVRDAIKRYLRHRPEAVSKARIKKLRGLLRPQYRLRMGEVRVFYDVIEDRVEILAIVRKEDAAAWLREVGRSNEAGSSTPGEG